MVVIAFLFIPANITADIPIRFIENPTMASHKKFCNDIEKKSNSKITTIKVNSSKEDCATTNLMAIADKESLTRFPVLLSSYACIG